MTGTTMRKPFYCINHLDFDGNKLIVEGFFVVKNQSANIFVKDEKGNYSTLMITDADNADSERAFKFERTIGKKKAFVDFCYSTDGKIFSFAHCEQGERSPFNDMPSSYYYKKGYVATMVGATIKAQRIGWLRHLVYQEKYMRDLQKKAKTDPIAKQSYRLRRLYNVLNPLYSGQNIKIVVDRYLTEGDKGSACYNRLAEDTGFKVYFAVDASKRGALALPSDRIIPTGSKKHKRLLLCAQTIVCSPFDSKETFFIEPTYIKDILAKKSYSVL